jgi:hypothetical protein
MELVPQRVQKGRHFSQETGIIIMTEMFITVCFRDIYRASSLSFACGLFTIVDIALKCIYSLFYLQSVFVP